MRVISAAIFALDSSDTVPSSVIAVYSGIRIASRRLSLREVLECFEVVDDVRHGGPYALALADRSQVRKLFASASRKRQRTSADPGLLDLHVVRHILDKFMECRLFLLVSPGGGKR